MKKLYYFFRKKWIIWVKSKQRLGYYQTSIIFAPISDRCIINTVFSETNFSKNTQYLIDTNHRHIFDLINDSKQLRRILFFGHNNKTLTGIKINKNDENTLLARFFQVENHTYDLAYFFVCQGKTIFSSRSWSGVFKNWIAHDEHLYIIVGEPYLNQTWSNIFGGIHKILDSERNSEVAADKIITHYKQIYYGVYDEYDYKGEKLLLMMYLYKAKRSLYHSYRNELRHLV